MNIYIYAKLTENLSSLEDTIRSMRSKNDRIFITTENVRASRELDKLIKKSGEDDCIVISTLDSLGLSNDDKLKRLAAFITRPVLLVVAGIPSTYEYGVSQPMNKAVLTTIAQSLSTKSENVLSMPFDSKKRAGRNRIEFPENWSELYEAWENKEISSKVFLEKSCLKKATFYNLITEYKAILEANDILKRQFLA